MIPKRTVKRSQVRDRLSDFAALAVCVSRMAAVCLACVTLLLLASDTFNVPQQPRAGAAKSRSVFVTAQMCVTVIC
jgi:hypothetical protein